MIVVDRGFAATERERERERGDSAFLYLRYRDSHLRPSQLSHAAVVLYSMGLSYASSTQTHKHTHTHYDWSDTKRHYWSWIVVVEKSHEYGVVLIQNVSAGFMHEGTSSSQRRPNMSHASIITFFIFSPDNVTFVVAACGRGMTQIVVLQFVVSRIYHRLVWKRSPTVVHGLIFPIAAICGFSSRQESVIEWNYRFIISAHQSWQSRERERLHQKRPNRLVSRRPT